MSQKKKPFTSIDDIRKRLEDSIDTGWYDSIYSQLCYAFGEGWKGRVSNGQEGSLPYYPAITLYTKKVGRSMKIITSSLVTLSEIMDAEPEPSWTQCNKWVSESRKQTWLKAWKSRGWKSEHERAYLEGEGVGLGVLQWGVKQNPDTGEDYTTCRHSPLLQTITDVTAVGPDQWRFIAFAKYMAVEDAVAIYGESKRKDIESATHRVDEDNVTQEVVRVIEYYDKGFGTGKPTQCVLIDDIGGAVLVEPEENQFGRKLPCSYYEHVLLPGMRRHIGKIILQMATQEARNDLEKAIRDDALTGSLDVVETDLVDKAEFKGAMKRGEKFVFAKGRALSDTRPVVQRIQARESSSTTFNLLSLYDRELNAEGGTTDLEKGSSQKTGTETLGELQLIDARSQKQKGRSTRQAMYMYIRSVEQWEAISKQFETQPTDIDVFGTNMTINGGDPRMSIDQMLDEPSEVVISPASLTQQDVTAKTQKRITELQILAQNPLIDQKWVAEQMCKALNEDPEEAMVKAAPMPQMQPNPGMPNQGVPTPI